MTDKTILHVENLKVIFPNPAGVVRAVEGVSLSVREGECAAIVGESGSGKSVTSLAVMKLLSTPSCGWTGWSSTAGTCGTPRRMKCWTSGARKWP